MSERHYGPAATGTFTTGEVPVPGEQVRYDAPGRPRSGKLGEVVNVRLVVRLEDGVTIERDYNFFERIA
jgi:hypothetical protein